jgi:hypothetical protein
MSYTFNRRKVRKRYDKASQHAQFILDQQILKDTNEYVPKDTGNLVNSSIIHSVPGSGLIVWSTKYVRRLYYGTQMRFSKDRNGKAQALWFEASKANNKRRWLDVARNAFKGGF